MNGDLFGAALSGDMLSARQLRATTVAGEADEVLGYKRYRPPRALLPRGVGRRVNDDLTDDSPTRVVRIATRNQKPRQRLRHPKRTRLERMSVQVP